MTDTDDHTAAPGMWSYACKCLRCQWEQWWNEGDNTIIPMPDQPHPDGEYQTWHDERHLWDGPNHPNE